MWTQPIPDNYKDLVDEALTKTELSLYGKRKKINSAVSTTVGAVGTAIGWTGKKGYETATGAVSALAPTWKDKFILGGYIALGTAVGLGPIAGWAAYKMAHGGSEAHASTPHP